jgi:hypothetical protein
MMDHELHITYELYMTTYNYIWLHITYELYITTYNYIELMMDHELNRTYELYITCDIYSSWSIIIYDKLSAVEN